MSSERWVYVRSGPQVDVVERHGGRVADAIAERLEERLRWDAAVRGRFSVPQAVVVFGQNITRACLAARGRRELDRLDLELRYLRRVVFESRMRMARGPGARAGVEQLMLLDA